MTAAEVAAMPRPEETPESTRSGRWRIALAVNAGSGAALSASATDLADEIAGALSARGDVVATAASEGEAFFTELETLAAREDIDVLAVAGGDGTISAAASIAWRADKRLLPIPCGTFNLFCRTLGFPPDPHGSIETFGILVPDEVDIGVANGEVFVHHVSGGLHPRFVRIRDSVTIRSRFQKILASVRAVFRAVRSIPRTPMIVMANGESHSRRLAGFAVTVNSMAEIPASPPMAEDPKAGILAIYMTGLRNRRDALWIIARALAGAWKSSALVETLYGDAATIVMRRKRLMVSLDGERKRMTLPLEVRLERQALKVLRPDAGDHDVGDAASVTSSSSSSSGRAAPERNSPSPFSPST